MIFMVKLMCFALLCGSITCRPTNELVLDYRRDLDGMTIGELCAKYPNEATFPNSFLSCMCDRNFDVDVKASLDGHEDEITKMLDVMKSIEKAHRV